MSRCLFLFLFSLQAQQDAPLVSQTWVDLSGPWKITTSDDPRFASPEFDDSAWRTIVLPGIDPGGRQRAVFWIRRTVHLPPGVDRSALSLTLGKISENYGVWINGAPVATVGDLTVRNQQLARPRIFDLPGLPDGPLTIAVRAVQLPRLTGSSAWHRFPDPGPYLITARSNAPRRAGEDWLADLRSRRSPDLVVGVACSTLGLILLLMYLGERSRHEVLYLALYGMALAWRRSEVFFGIGPETTPWRYAVFLGPLLNLSIGLFTARIFGIRWRWLPAILALNAALCYGAVPYFAFFRIQQLLTAGVMAACTLRTRDLPGRVLAGALWLLFFTQVLTDTPLASLETLRDLITVNSFGFNSPLHPIYAVFFLLAMVLVLTRRALADNSVKQRLQGELEAARTVQQLLIPANNAPGIDAVYLPAAEVGGDFWHLPGGRLLVVGDVSGKGLKAAMVVSLITGMLDRLHADSPAAVLAELNAALRARLDGGFVTCCVARLEADGQVTIANAGHPAPYADGREVDLAAGLPLGLTADAEYTESTVRYEHYLTLISDGVVEAANAKGELFGFERTCAIASKSAQEIAEAARAWGQNDDITVVTVRRVA